ncbi:MAG: hypothetical protein PF442_10800 [Desulfobulbaceae bacterium]|nr:hypothetical protein [Desulfobulbaceae bacterium]
MLTPVDKSEGTGTSRQFNFQNLMEICIAKELTVFKISVEIVGVLMQSLRNGCSEIFECQEGKQVITNIDYDNDMILIAQVVYRSKDGVGTSTVTRIEKRKKMPKIVSEFWSRPEAILTINLTEVRRSLLAAVSSSNM